jgi:hypothetical protein
VIITSTPPLYVNSCSVHPSQRKRRSVRFFSRSPDGAAVAWSSVLQARLPFFSFSFLFPCPLAIVEHGWMGLVAKIPTENVHTLMDTHHSIESLATDNIRDPKLFSSGRSTGRGTNATKIYTSLPSYRSQRTEGKSCKAPSLNGFPPRSATVQRKQFPKALTSVPSSIIVTFLEHSCHLVFRRNVKQTLFFFNGANPTTVSYNAK